MAKFSIEKTKEFDLEKLNDLRNEFYKKQKDIYCILTLFPDKIRKGIIFILMKNIASQK